MVLSKRVGAILREARELRKLSVKDVGRETNITPRYIEALEGEDYSQFPGETYALGFLRNYAEYLNLDTDHLINLYRGHQIDLSEAPLKELTRATSPVLPFFNLSAVNPRYWYLAAGAGALILIIASFASGLISLPHWSSSSGGGAYCQRDEVTPITLPPQGSLPREEQLSLSNAVRFTTGAHTLVLCLDKVERGADQQAIGAFHLRINEDHNYSFEAREGQTITLDASAAELAGLDRPVLITPDVLGDVSARVAIETGAGSSAVVPPTESETPEGNPPGQNNPPGGGGDIQVTLQFDSVSFLSWVEDGAAHSGREIAAGERRTLEARNRLEIRIGNGAGVRIFREGAAPRVAGPPGKIVNLVYRRVPHPLDPGASRIEESIEVVQ
ncbi:MAG: helix-turn-helix domain-containing protein [Leptospirales bacterium]|nr:helix-turn-helix domain-containing protein [Leptospirales bacterium]